MPTHAPSKQTRLRWVEVRSELVALFANEFGRRGLDQIVTYTNYSMPSRDLHPISSCLNILKDPLPGTISRGNVSMAGFELWTSNDESTWSVSCTYSVQIFLWLFWGLFICLGFIGSSLKRPPIKHLKSHAARRCKTFIVSKFCEKCLNCFGIQKLPVYLPKTMAYRNQCDQMAVLFIRHLDLDNNEICPRM